MSLLRGEDNIEIIAAVHHDRSKVKASHKANCNGGHFVVHGMP